MSKIFYFCTEFETDYFWMFSVELHSANGNIDEQEKEVRSKIDSFTHELVKNPAPAMISNIMRRCSIPWRLDAAPDTVVDFFDRRYLPMFLPRTDARCIGCAYRLRPIHTTRS